MSGPKHIPRPTYTMNAFDGQLDRVFRLQTRLNSLVCELDSSQVNNTNLNIFFDCRSELSVLQKRIKQAVNVLIFNYNGRFGQETYNKIKKEINTRVSELNKLLGQCETIRQEFLSKQEDYNSYVSYLQYYESSKNAHETYQQQVSEYLTRNLESVAPDILSKAKNSLLKIDFDLSKVDFNFGFSSLAERERNNIIDFVKEKEIRINDLRNNVSNEAIERFQDIQEDSLEIETNSETADETNEVFERIELLLRKWENSVVKKLYQEKFDSLKQSQSLSNLYFFKELHDSIIDKMNDEERKNKINRLLADINSLDIHQSLENDKKNFIHLCLTMLDSSRISNKELNRISDSHQNLIIENKNIFEEEEIKNKQNLFLKSQIILCLENLGYEVIDDLNVIDFERENDFLLKINRQNNCVNLKFKEDGSMRYVFQIPEEKESLSTDQKKLKLHEMKVSCDDFKGVLDDLGKMGLEISLDFAKEVDEDFLISVPKAKRDKIKVEKADKAGSKVELKNYLDN